MYTINSDPRNGTDAVQAQEQVNATELETLQYAPPDPKSSTQLTKALITKLLGCLEKWFKWLQKNYGNDVDVPCWKKLAKEIFGSIENLKPIVCPARAGFGKSTFIKALLLTLCELKINNDPLADVFGGVILVVQKVETLNEIHDIIYRAFPGAGPDLMIPLQGLTPSGLKSGVCLNECQMDPPRCFGSSCTFSRECKLRYYEENVGQAYVLGITQSRFYRLRTTDNLAKYLSIRGAPSPRRIFIFDEVFNFADSQVLLAEAASAASIELETLAAKLAIPDRLISRVETRFSCTVRNFFQHLRSDTVYSVDGVTQADLKYGTCTLEDLPEKDKKVFLNFKEYLETKGRRYLSENVRLGINVVADLLESRCLFTKLPNFSILSPGTPQLTYGDATTLVFDATAQLDPNYEYLDADILDVPPPEHMDMVTFHVFTHPDMNTSRNAFVNPWKLPALCAVVDELLEQYPGKTFLCTYMDYSEAFSRKLSQKSLLQIIPLSNNARGLSIPYRGGNNGSNDFNQAVNCILIGIPRPRMWLAPSRPPSGSTTAAPPPSPVWSPSCGNGTAPSYH